MLAPVGALVVGDDAGVVVEGVVVVGVLLAGALVAGADAGVVGVVADTGVEAGVEAGAADAVAVPLPLPLPQAASEIAINMHRYFFIAFPVSTTSARLNIRRT